MHVIDSHTGGEPTQVILDGGPDLGGGSVADRARCLAEQHRDFCHTLTREPRGQPGLVGALLVEPHDPSCDVGVIYFDSHAVLGMCGHGTIGLAATLAHTGRFRVGGHRIETPAGPVELNLADANTVTITNIESRRSQAGVVVEVAGLGTVTGDVAYGGNWFFIVDPSPIPVLPENIDRLTEATLVLRHALTEQGIAGDSGETIDHVIFQGEPSRPGIHSRNFVLCPNGAYDRSPCGTGSSARLACLAAEGRLEPGEEIIQESVIGSTFRLSYQPGIAGGVIPRITGAAYVTAESKLVFSDGDPFLNGIQA